MWRDAGYESCSSRSASQSPATSQDAACQTSSTHCSAVNWTSSVCRHHHPLTSSSCTLLPSSSRTKMVNGCGTALHQNGSVTDHSAQSINRARTKDHHHHPSPPLHHHHHHQQQQQQRSLSLMTRQHGQLVQAMMHLLESDRIRLSEHPYTNHVRCRPTTTTE